MKKITYIISVAMLALAASSCEDFLKANASKTISVDDLYSTREGYESALAGVYLSAIGQNLYGCNATYRINDLAAVPYNYVTDTKIVPGQRHEWDNRYVKEATSDIWFAAYKTVANINMMLRYLDRSEGILTQYEADIMKGELLGVRAFIHFDLMRMFGLNTWDGENASKMTVPYVTEFKKDATEQKSYSETAVLLHKDIDDALALLEKDMVRSADNVPDNFQNTGNINGFWNNRRSRMNYYAALALKANVLMWEKNLKEAASTAKSAAAEMLESGFVQWNDADAYLNAPGDNERNLTFTTEHIWNLVGRSLAITASGNLWTTATSTAAFVIEPDVVQNVLYPQVDPITGSNSGAEDIRGYAGLLKFTSSGFACHKFFIDGLAANMYSAPGNCMPMLRLSQLYYIMAEEAAQNGRNAEALGYLDEVRAARGITEKLDPDKLNAADEIEKEYYREFVGEGRLFYFLKYRNVERSLSSRFNVSADVLMYDYPDAEINFGRNQER